MYTSLGPMLGRFEEELGYELLSHMTELFEETLYQELGLKYANDMRTFFAGVRSRQKYIISKD